MAAKKKAATAKKKPGKGTGTGTGARMRGAPAGQVAERLAKAVPEPVCELKHKNGFQLLIATILSAQSTDKTVNSVTPVLFERWPTPAALAAAEQEEVEEVVKRTGFFRNKAKAIRGTAAALVASHGGEVPRTLDAMVTLPGVARKTANVVLGSAYGIASGFVVDTHVARVAKRLELTEHDDPRDIEADLSAHFPQAEWVDMGHRILLHGRYTCLAKAPMCTACPLNVLCPSKEASPDHTWQERARGEAIRVADGMAG